MFIKHLKRESPWIPLVLMTLSVAVWTEMDLFVPALPSIMKYFDTTEEVIQWTLSFNFFGFFIASLFCGALSDALGRRVVLLSGTLVFLFGSLFTVMATQIEVFLFGRFLQGIGVSAPAVITMAIMADLYQGTLFIRWTSFCNSLVATTMALAPILGAYLTETFGWRSNFMTIACSALFGFMLVFLWVPETLPAQNRQAFKFRLLVSNYRSLLLSRKFIDPMVGMCFLITPYFVFIGIISLLFMNSLQVPMQEYVWYQGSIVGTFAFLSLLVLLLGDRIDLDRWMKLSIGICLVSALSLFLHGLFLPDNALSLTVLMCILISGMVIPVTVLYMKAIQVFPDLQASSSALFQAVRMLMLAVGTAIAGAVYNGYYMPIGWMTGISVFLASILVFPLLKEKTHVKDSSGMAHPTL